MIDKKADAARVRAYRRANPDKVRATNKRRYASPEARAKTSEATKRWALANPDRYAAIRNLASIKHRLKRHGLTIAQFDAILVAQNYRCAICKSDTPGIKRSGKHGPKRRLAKGWPTTAQQGDFAWHVNHDPKTGEVRGLLCASCTRAMIRRLRT
jgi:hypothetical protein